MWFLSELSHLLFRRDVPCSSRILSLVFGDSGLLQEQEQQYHEALFFPAVIVEGPSTQITTARSRVLSQKEGLNNPSRFVAQDHTFCHKITSRHKFCCSPKKKVPIPST